MNDPAADQRWRDKYLEALGTQETLEKQFADYRHLLWRALVQLGALVQGQNEELEELLDRVCEQARGGDIGELAHLLNRLEQALESFERQRNQRCKDMGASLQNTVAPLQKLSLSRELRRDIRDYLTRLPRRSRDLNLYPALLEQLAEIQRQVLIQLQKPREPGLLDRFRGRSLEPPAAVSAQELPDDEIPLPELCNRVGGILQDLLNSVQIPDEEKLASVQRRLAAGLDLEDLLPALNDVRDLVMRSYLAANQAFADYLTNVNGELADIHAALGGAAEDEAQRALSRQTLDSDMQQEMVGLAGQVASATDLKQLKSQVESRLGNIREVLAKYHSAEASRQPLTEQLEHLSSRLQTMEHEAERSRASLAEQRHKALHDPLTGVPNREAYDERISHEVQRWQRYGHPLTIAVCDLDHFKRINDSFGHQAGDRVLKVISRTIAKRLRQVDFFGRYGGEEFVVILPETSTDDALVVLDKIRAAIAETAFHYREKPLAITLSMGIAGFGVGDTPDAVFERADKALYAAKAAGRNQCRCG